MTDFPHIDTMFKRDKSKGRKGPLLLYQYSRPEFEYLKDSQWTWTEKVDGTNLHVQYQPAWKLFNEEPALVQFLGRTPEAQIPEFLQKHLELLFTTEKLAAVFPDLEVLTDENDIIVVPNVSLFGEGIGGHLGNYGPEPRFLLFDVAVRSGSATWWLERKNVEDVARKLGVPAVPVVGHGTLTAMVETVRVGFTSHLVSYRDILDVKGIGPAEGIVAFPEVQLFNRKGERILTKLKYKDFPPGERVK